MNQLTSNFHLPRQSKPPRRLWLGCGRVGKKIKLSFLIICKQESALTSPTLCDHYRGQHLLIWFERTFRECENWNDLVAFRGRGAVLKFGFSNVDDVVPLLSFFGNFVLFINNAIRTSRWRFFGWEKRRSSSVNLFTWTFRFSSKTSIDGWELLKYH